METTLWTFQKSGFYFGNHCDRSTATVCVLVQQVRLDPLDPLGQRQIVLLATSLVGIFAALTVCDGDILVTWTRSLFNTEPWKRLPDGTQSQLEKRSCSHRPRGASWLCWRVASTNTSQNVNNTGVIGSTCCTEPANQSSAAPSTPALPHTTSTLHCLNCEVESMLTSGTCRTTGRSFYSIFASFVIFLLYFVKYWLIFSLDLKMF